MTVEELVTLGESHGVCKREMFNCINLYISEIDKPSIEASVDNVFIYNDNEDSHHPSISMDYVLRVYDYSTVSASGRFYPTVFINGVDHSETEPDMLFTVSEVLKYMDGGQWVAKQ